MFVYEHVKRFFL